MRFDANVRFALRFEDSSHFYYAHRFPRLQAFTTHATLRKID